MRLNISVIRPDFLEAGTSGPLVVLVHSGASGARQWRRLMDDLKDHYRVRVVNLFGYGATSPWPPDAMQSIADQANLVEGAIPADLDKVCLVGHSFGGLIAMKLAARLGGRVTKLVLLEGRRRLHGRSEEGRHRQTFRAALARRGDRAQPRHHGHRRLRSGARQPHPDRRLLSERARRDPRGAARTGPGDLRHAVSDRLKIAAASLRRGRMAAVAGGWRSRPRGDAVTGPRLCYHSPPCALERTANRSGRGAGRRVRRIQEQILSWRSRPLSI